MNSIMPVTAPLKPLEPGVYIGLNEDAYHRDPALGSTNLRQILSSTPDYWWTSWMNPMKPDDKDTKDRKRGRAIHKFVLEGGEAFHAKYMRRPDDDEGASPADKAALTKKTNADAKAKNKEALHADDFDRIMISGQMIVANPHLSKAFQDGMPEVSVFWEREDGVRCKIRIDYLKLRAISDLKSIANILNIDFVAACRREIRFRKAPIQACHYLDGRVLLKKFVADGAVHGVDHDSSLLKKLAASDEYAFTWVFFQAKGAPLTWGTKISHGNSLLDEARDQIEDAIDKFKANREQFGTSPWVIAEPLSELHSEDLPNSYY